MKKRLFILIISLLLTIVLLGTLTSPALAGKAAARGKIHPMTYGSTTGTTQASGQYVFYADVDVQGDIDTFTLSINVRKLTPRALYVVGYVISRPYAGDFYYDVYKFADNRGRIKYTFEANEDIFYSDDVFMAYVDTDTSHEELALSSDPVTLFPTQPTTPV